MKADLRTPQNAIEQRAISVGREIWNPKKKQNDRNTRRQRDQLGEGAAARWSRVGEFSQDYHGGGAGH
jgi:hypothetical protein